MEVIYLLRNYSTTDVILPDPVRFVFLFTLRQLWDFSGSEHSVLMHLREEFGGCVGWGYRYWWAEMILIYLPHFIAKKLHMKYLYQQDAHC